MTQRWCQCQQIGCQHPWHHGIAWRTEWGKRWQKWRWKTGKDNKTATRIVTFSFLLLHFCPVIVAQCILHSSCHHPFSCHSCCTISFHLTSSRDSSYLSSSYQTTIIEQLESRISTNMQHTTHHALLPRFCSTFVSHNGCGCTCQGHHRWQSPTCHWQHSSWSLSFSNFSWWPRWAPYEEDPDYIIIMLSPRWLHWLSLWVYAKCHQ